MYKSIGEEGNGIREIAGLIIKVKAAVIQPQRKSKSHRFSSKIQYLAATQKRKALERPKFLAMTRTGLEQRGKLGCLIPFLIVRAFTQHPEG